MPKLIRNTLLMFVAGWVGWFWIDKHGPAYRMTASLPQGQELTRDLQIGFDLIKAGELGPAFVYLWDGHYVLLSVLAGFLLSLVLSSTGRLAGRLRSKRRPSPREAPKKPAEPS